MNLNFSPKGTVLYEEDNIRYQVYSDEYYESTLESIVQSRVNETKGNLYQDFSINEESIKKFAQQCLKDTVFIIIAIDISKETPTVVSQLLGIDLTTFLNSSAASNSTFGIIEQRLVKPLKNLKYKFGDVLIGTSYGVKKEYQHRNIGVTLGMIFLKSLLGSVYKLFCGIIYNSKVLDTLLQLGTQVISEVKIEDCLSIDKNITSKMKNSFTLIGYIDKKKDVSSLQIPQSIFIRPSL